MSDRPLAPATLSAQGLGWIEPTTKAIVPPIHLSSTFERDADNQYRSGRCYSRADNPTYDQVEATLTALEQGDRALVFASGMAAATACFLSLDPGDHVIAPTVMYWALRNWLATFARRWGLQVSFVDTTNLADLQAAVQSGKTKLIWLETPANPLWHVTDIEAAAAIAHRAGARLIVDSTIAATVFTRPLTLGADIVMHAATKYLNGHSDLVAGALVTARDDDYWQRIRTVRSQIGGVLGSFEAWLLMRGLRTLHPRIRWAAASAQNLAERLAAHSQVAEVLYPGLATCVGHEIARKQMHDGFGAMLSIRVHGGAVSAIKTAARVEVWKRATSLGGVESLIEHRASIEGTDSPCPPDLLRLSVGIEDSNDLFADLDQALLAAHSN